MTLCSDGLFVSVDGPSGVGKTTTAGALAHLLRDDGPQVHLTCEPSEGPIGKLARSLTETVHGTALACLYAADRYSHLELGGLGSASSLDRGLGWRPAPASARHP